MMTESTTPSRKTCCKYTVFHLHRATESWYPWYPGDDADQKFKDAEFKSSLLAFWKTLNFANPTTNKKVTSKIGNVCNFLNSWRIRKIQSLPESLRGALNHGVF